MTGAWSGCLSRRGAALGSELHDIDAAQRDVGRLQRTQAQADGAAGAGGEATRASVADALSDGLGDMEPRAGGTLINPYALSRDPADRGRCAGQCLSDCSDSCTVSGPDTGASNGQTGVLPPPAASYRPRAADAARLRRARGARGRTASSGVIASARRCAAHARGGCRHPAGQPHRAISSRARARRGGAPRGSGRYPVQTPRRTTTVETRSRRWRTAARGPSSPTGR